MSSLLGSPHERLSLARAVDSLRDAARRAGRPSPVWLVGILYPGLNLNVDLVRGVLALIEQVSGMDLPGAGEMGPIVTLFAPNLPIAFHDGSQESESLWSVVLTLPLFLLVYRLIVGLALVSDPKAGEERPTLRSIWRAGEGLAAVGFGLWAMLLALLFGAMFVFIGPVVALLRALDLGDVSPLFAGLLVPALLLILAYAAVLMVLNQLALHSLAHNRRGVASALTHAWRLVRASPMSALRATVVDFVLFASILLVKVIFVRGLLPDAAQGLALLALYGFAGVARAGYWARAYRSLGGLSAADGVPGL